VPRFIEISALYKVKSYRVTRNSC